MGNTIIQLLHFDPRGRRSMEAFLMMLAAQLRENRWQTVHVFSNEPGDYVRGELERLNLPYLVAEFPLSPRGAWTLGRRLRAYRPAIIQTAFLSALSLGG